MLLTPSEKPHSSRYFRKTASLLMSVCLHALVIAGAFMLPIPDGSRARTRVTADTSTEFEQIRHRVIWLRKNDRLPAISPTMERSDAGTGAKDAKKLAVLANPPAAKHWDQFIYVPLPTVEDQKAIPAPSMVVTQLKSELPPKPDARKFVPPPDQPRKTTPRTVDLQEPAIANHLGRGLDLQAPTVLAKLDAPKPPSKRFVPPPEPPRKVPARVLEVPEGLPVQAADLIALQSPVGVGLPDAPRPPGRKFVPPAAISGAGSGGARGGASAEQVISIPEAATRPVLGGVPGEVSAVIISTTPTANASMIPPEGNRLSKIRSGSLPGGAPGNTSSAAAGEGLVVAGLTVRGGNGSRSGGATTASSPVPAPLAASPVTPTGMPVIRPRLDTPSISIPQRPNSRRVPQQVEGVFQNRVVYCTVMPGPAGVPDWVLWFGETGMPAPGSRSIMRPPVAGTTALPSGAVGNSAEVKLWIIARLGKSGRLSVVSIPEGISAEHARELAAEMEKWVFTPAIRNGEAVDVDLVLEAKLATGRPRP